MLMLGEGHPGMVKAISEDLSGAPTVSAPTI